MIEKFSPPAGRPTLNLSDGGEALAAKLHEVMTPASGTAYWPFGEVDWIRVLPAKQGLGLPETGVKVSPTRVAAPAPEGTAISAAAVTSDANDGRLTNLP